MSGPRIFSGRGHPGIKTRGLCRPGNGERDSPSPPHIFKTTPAIGLSTLIFQLFIDIL